MQVLSGDIGGTNTRLALYETDGESFELQAEEIFPSGDHAGLTAIVRTFLHDRRPLPQRACFGIAGPVRQGRVETTNLPWVVDAREMEVSLGIPRVLLVNDLEAQAWGIATLAEDDLVLIKEGDSEARGNAALIAAGTGLGEAGFYWDGHHHRPFATEGGHTDFAPQSELEIRLLGHLSIRWGHVSYERVVSGPGLVNLYEFLRAERGGDEPDWLRQKLESSDPAAAISAAALDGSCQVCSEALDLFVRLYGAEAGNLALKLGATGGVYLGGGIAPQILDRLRTPIFAEAFCAKGRMRPLVEAIPVRVILNPGTALLGAARCAVVEGE